MRGKFMEMLMRISHKKSSLFTGLLVALAACAIVAAPYTASAQEKSRPSALERLKQKRLLQKSPRTPAKSARQSSALPKTGVVLFAQGVTMSQPAKDDGSRARLLGKGATIYKNDVLKTGSRSFALIQLDDGSKMTIHPNSSFVVEEFSNTKGSSAKAVLKLFRGGFRAVTGAISKKNPNGYRVNTPTATLGIRGTDFAVLVCDAKCVEENKKKKAAGEKSSVRKRVIGRIAFMRGQMAAKEYAGGKRTIRTGSALFEGDTLVSNKKSIGVVVMKDTARFTIKPSTEFKIEELKFSKKNPKKNSASYRLLKGSLRAVSGIVGKRNNKRFRMRTPVATIGIRGTAFDVSCEGACGKDLNALMQEEKFDLLATILDFFIPSLQAQAPFNFNRNLAVYTRQGETNLQVPGQRPFPIPAGRVGALPVGGGAPQPRLLPGIPQQFRNDPSRRPETVKPKTKDRFGTSKQNTPTKGSVQLTVYKGDVRMRSNSNPSAPPRNVSQGESASMNLGGGVQRLNRPPPIMNNFGANDPNTFNPETGTFAPPTNPDGSKGKKNQCVMG